MKKFGFTEEFSNEAMNSVMGGASCSRISITISKAQDVKAAAVKSRDSDSDAETEAAI